jgi:membrane-bound serine protease (ClpP class)
MFSTNSHFLGGLALAATQQKDQGYTSAVAIYSSMVGREGISRTVLRPSGKVEIDDDIFDATSETGFIDKDEPVKVTRYSNTQLFVRKISS